MGPETDLDAFALIRLAPAKLNLALHVVGQRADGYHNIESLVTFADAGDRVGFRLADEDRFTISGRFAADLAQTGDVAAQNLVLVARDRLRQALQAGGATAGPVHLHLEKNLPVASGIGGGSADAAATLLGLCDLWRADLPPEVLRSIALRLGADVPMCCAGRPLLATGIGENLASIEGLPAFPLLIVNPLRAVSTPSIFRMLATKTNPPLVLPDRHLQSKADWIDCLKRNRNDLELPARGIEPVIAEVCDALEREQALFVRMSGSGASCFGLFETVAKRDQAATHLSRRHPGWYGLACNSIGSSQGYHGGH